MKRIVAVVEPVLVAGPRQAIAKLDDVADVRGGNRRVGRRISDSRTVIQPIPGAALAKVTRDLDRQVRRSRHL